MDGSCAASVPADGEERKDGRPPAASPTVHDSGTKPDDVFEFLRCARQLKARLADMLKPTRVRLAATRLIRRGGGGGT